jgi:predicted dinucleotide-binding enzyme/DMSO/TMAO reductase YedYZ heme-binding membrane subunit
MVFRLPLFQCLKAMDTAYILGTGDYAKALAKRFLRSGYDVVCGSQQPERRNLAASDPALASVEVISIQSLIKKADVIFVAIHAEHYHTLYGYITSLKGTILVDVSNPDSVNDNRSNAGTLQKMLPWSHVVKGFNTVSAYAMESQACGESKTVHICGNDAPSKDIIKEMAQDLGFGVVDHGGIAAAKELENMPLELFKEWQGAAKVTGIMFAIWLIYGMARYLYLKKDPYTWDRAPSNITNKAFACTALTLLAITYLPGCIAGFVQLYNGTKHKRFSPFLNDWLKMRKQLGVFALGFALLHLIISITLMSPAYFKPWYITDTAVLGSFGDKVPLASRMNYLGEIVLLCGVVSFVLMALLGLTSIQAVGDQLNWREWSFIHSYLGYTCLFAAACHVTVVAVPDWLGEPWHKAMQRLTFLSSVLPWLVLGMKLVLALPGISDELAKIRRGWERGRDGAFKRNQ